MNIAATNIHAAQGHALLRYKIPKFVWVWLLGLGLLACYHGFIWAGSLFDRRRYRASLLAAGSVIPAGGFIAAFAVAAWLSY